MKMESAPQAHHRFKEALDQALRVRGSRDFGDRASYERFVAELVKQRNQTRKPRFKEDLAALAPLPQAPLSPCREVRVRVSRFSTIIVLGNTYSVPSRLIGTRIIVRVRAERIEGYVGTKLAFGFPRLIGKQQKRIEYRHVIWSLVKKPAAKARVSLSGGTLPHHHLPQDV
jgi:hypothetical protein